MNDKDHEIAERFKELVSRKVKIYELQVFGSRARGDASAESDIDVLIVVEQLDHSIGKYISECAWEAGFPEDVIVMPIAISLDTLRNSPIRESIFIKNIYREGIAV